MDVTMETNRLAG